MFLSRRSAQAEYFDTPLPPAEITRFCAALRRLNRFFVFAEPFQRFIPRILGADGCRHLCILDLGAGDGSLGNELGAWAAERGWRWHFTNLDISRAALALNPEGSNVAGSVLALPFRPASFDLVVASQMTHHLSEADAQLHFREAWRVARRAIVIADLHRNVVLYTVLWCYFRVGSYQPQLVSDALISVQRGWRLNEFRELAASAGIPGARTRLYFGARVVLHATKMLGSDAV